MRKSQGFAGKVLIRKRDACVADLERYVVERAQLVEQLRQTDAMIRATQAYIRELDIRSGHAVPDRRLRGDSSIRHMVLSVLAGADRPMRALEIQTAIQQEFNRYVERTSLSPILSKLREAGTLEHSTKLGWSIP
jgi:hypothetical protein